MRRAAMATSNRTGIESSGLAAQMEQVTSMTKPSSAGNGDGLVKMRLAYFQPALTVGTMPPPSKARGRATGMLRGGGMSLLLDKIGERLAFERTGTRLYDMLLTKHRVHGSWSAGPSAGDLTHIRDEEHEHFLLCETAMKELGGDPTAVTPSADVQGVASSGLPAVLADPRTNLHQCLEAMVTAELVDNDCWENLIALARAMGQHDLGERFEQALEQEREHLVHVRAWVRAAIAQEASVELEPSAEGMRTQPSRPKRQKHDGTARRRPSASTARRRKPAANRRKRRRKS